MPAGQCQTMTSENTRCSHRRYSRVEAWDPISDSLTSKARVAVAREETLVPMERMMTSIPKVAPYPLSHSAPLQGGWFVEKGLT